MLDATKCFRVSAIRLVSASFDTTADVSEMLIDHEACTGQSKRLTSHKFIDREAGGEHARFLFATVSLGFRLINNDEATDEAGKVLYTIHASFVAEFEVRSTDYDEASLDRFVKQNATHVVWPFWRQHVYSTLQSASLPAISIPLMAGISRVKHEPNDPAGTLSE